MLSCAFSPFGVASVGYFGSGFLGGALTGKTTVTNRATKIGPLGIIRLLERLPRSGGLELFTRFLACLVVGYPGGAFSPGWQLVAWG